MPQQWIWGAPGGGVTDHGALTGLADDDHSQYHNDARGDLRYSQLGHNHDATYAPLSHTHLEADITDLGSYLTEAAADLIYAAIAHTHSLALDDLSNVDETGVTDGYVLTYDTDTWVPAAPATGVTDHGALTGLADDDHAQYHNDARGDARYSLLAHNHDSVYYTESEIDALLLGYSAATHNHDAAYSALGHNHSGVYSPVGHTHTESDITDLGAYLTEAAADLLYADIAHTHGAADHGALSGLADDDHTQYHTDARGDARYSLLAHNHDASYYTETEVNSLLTGYSPTSHNHDASYSALGHNHDASYSATGHTHTLDGLSDVNTTGAADGKVLTYDTGVWVASTPASGVTDHGLLTGLSDDDHVQYHNDTRGDARYSLLGHDHDAAYYTETEVNSLLTGYSPTTHNHTGVYSAVGHTHVEADISDLGTYLTEAAADLLYSDISHTHSAPDHGALSGLTDDDHTQYALLAGRSGGQTLYGGTASGDDMYLNSTSHATKGHVAIQSGGGIAIVGYTTPTYPSDAIIEYYAGSTLRSAIGNRGAQDWYLNSGTAEAGTISYGTPGGGPGIIFHGPSFAYRFDFARLADYTHLHYTDDTTGLIVRRGGQVGVNTTTPQKKLHVAGTILVDGDEGGYAGTIGLTDINSTTVTNAYIVKGGQAANTVNTGWIKMYVGTTAVWVPYWANATP